MKKINFKDKNFLISFSFFIIGLVMLFSSSITLNTKNSDSVLSYVGISRPGVSELASTTETIPYVPLIRSSGDETLKDNDANLASLLITLFRWGLSISVALAIFFIIKGGIQYTVTDSISGKATGKETIKSAIIGLLLALSSFLILDTINPQLLNLEITQRKTIDFNSPGGPDE